MKNRKEDLEFVSFREISERFKAFPISSLRHYRFKNINNFNNCVINIGDKLLICVGKFIDWIESHQEKQKND